MKARGYIFSVLAVLLIAVGVQYLLVLYVPNIIFAIAKKRSQQPHNTIIHAPKTDAKLRRVVLPNPDFVYSAIFYDVTEHDVIVSGVFPDSGHYACLAFYGDDMQPYHVVSNQKGFTGTYQFRLSKTAESKDDLTRVIAKTPQGSILIRLLHTNSQEEQAARQVQKQLKVVVTE